MAPRVLFAAAVLAVVLPANARQQARVTRIDARDGLSHNTVNDILQGRDGYLWVATYDGLNRYNGREFEVFRFPPGHGSGPQIYSNVIDNLVEDNQGRIWFSSSGVGYLDRAENRLVMVNPTEGPDFRGQVYRALVDPEGRLWECGSGIPGGCRTVASARPLGIAGVREIWDPVLDDAGRIWWVETDSTGRSMEVFVAEAGNVVATPITLGRLRASVQQALNPAGDGTVWIAGETPGAFDLEERTFEAVAGWPEGQLAATVRPLADGSVLFGTEFGLFRLDGGSGALTHVALTEGASPIGLWIQEIMEDREGLVWLGTRSGLYRLDWASLPFRHLGTASANDPEGLPVALEMIADEGGIWVGTLGRGVVRVKDGRYLEYSRRRGTLCGDQVWSLRQVEGAVWALTEAGLCRLDPESAAVSTRVLRPSKDGGVIAPAHPTGLWFWSGESGPILRLDADGTELESLDPEMGPWSMFDDGRYLWLGGYGIHRIDLAARDGLETFGMISNIVFDMREGADSLLWLATGAGPAVLDRRTGALRLVETEHPLPGRVIYSAIEDEAGSLWLGSNRGLVRLQPTTGKFRVYGPEDGVLNVEFDRRAFARGPDGAFYFGGLDGVTAFHPAQVRPNRFAPTVALAGAIIEEPGRPVRTVPLVDQILHIPPKSHSFSLRLDALLFSDPTRVDTRFRLRPYDPGWVTGQEVRYTRVPPGSYTFDAMAASVDEVAGPVTSLAIRVLPRAWETWWFRLLVLAAAAGVVWAFVNVRLAHRRRLESLRLRIATDLHDEVGSHLSGIAIMADVIRGLDTDPRLEKISSSARDMVQRLREIVWAVDPTADRAGTLVEHLDEIATTMLGGRSWGIEVVGFDEGRPMGMEVRHQVALIVREALHNAIRHGDPRHVSIELNDQKECLEIRVVDDGCGFADPRPGHGLTSMTERAESVGGTFSIDSTPGLGTRAVIRVPWVSVGWRDRAMPRAESVPNVDRIPKGDDSSV